MKKLVLIVLTLLFVINQSISQNENQNTVVLESEASIRKVFLSVLTPYLTQRGYKPFLDGGAPSYLRWEGNIVYHFFFNFLSNNSISASTMHITHYEVEDYVLKFELPNFSSMDIYRTKDKNHLSTVYQKSKPKSLENRPLHTKQEVIEFANNYIQYLENEAKAYTEEYRYLPNILDAMDKDWKDGKYWSKILGGGGPHHLLDGLIISKLCGDPEFQTKYSFINDLFMNKIDEEWKLVWIKFVPILKSIQPKYKKN